MTVLSKCETCRARKVKCDEKLPFCSQCVTRGWTCVYKHNGQKPSFFYEQIHGRESDWVKIDSKSPDEPDSQIPNNGGTALEQIKEPVLPVSLRLKQCRAASYGVGSFMTFASRPAKARKVRRRYLMPADKILPKNRQNPDLMPHPTAPLWSSNMALAMQWISSMALTPCGGAGDVFDLWTRHIPSRVGHTDYLDLAVAYFVDSMALFLCSTESNDKKACVAGQRALQSLRESLSCDRVDAVYLMLAITLHRYAESFRNLKTNSHVPHIRAIARIFGRGDLKSLQSEIVLSIVSVTYMDEVIEAVVQGQDSSLDTMAFRKVPLLKSNPANDAHFHLQALFVRIPRLVRLVRSAVWLGNDIDATTEASMLAEALYTSFNNSRIEQTLAERTTSTTTSFAMIPPIAEFKSFGFQSLTTYVLATQYYAFRVLLCGLILSLCSSKYGTGVFNETAIQDEDIAAATSIAMCAKYALKSDKESHIVAMRLLFPIQLAFGSWHRLQKAQARRPSIKTEGNNVATRMKHWCIDIAGKIDHMWGNMPTDYHLMEQVCETFAGRPIPADMSNWVNGRM